MAEIPSDIRSMFIADDFDSSQFFTEKGGFLHYEFAEYLSEQHNGILLDGKPHLFDGKKYVSLDKNTIRKLTLNYIPSLKENQNKEVFYKLEALCSKNPQEQAPPYFIGVKNGIIDIRSMQLQPFTPEVHITNIINSEYEPNVKSELVEKFIKDLSNNDEEVIQLLYEMIGYGLYRDNFLQKAFFFFSPGGNGKSTLFKLLHHFYGTENTTALSFKDIQSRFKPASLQSTMVNIADDIDPDFIKETGNYKTIVTGDKFNAERKGQDDFNFTPYVKLMFAGNELPQTSDRSRGFYRRMILIPMLKKFGQDGEKGDPMIIHKLKEPKHLKALLNLSLKGLSNILKEGRIKEPKISLEYKSQYEYDNDPIMQFINESTDDKHRTIPAVEGRPTERTYAIYQSWCQKNGLLSVSKPKLTRELRRIGYEAKEKWSREYQKTIRFYAKDTTTSYYDFDGSKL